MSQGNSIFQGFLLLIAALILMLVYVFQHSDFLALIGIDANVHPNATFIINRYIRLVLNDFACMIIIYALFTQMKYLRMAFLVFLVELLVLLPLYLAIKLSLEGDSEISSPLLSHMHRLLVNPLLMFLLMGGFFYQKIKK